MGDNSTEKELPGAKAAQANAAISARGSGELTQEKERSFVNWF
jgi:hypothetical protein